MWKRRRKKIDALRAELDAERERNFTLNRDLLLYAGRCRELKAERRQLEAKVQKYEQRSFQLAQALENGLDVDTASHRLWEYGQGDFSKSPRIEDPPPIDFLDDTRPTPYLDPTEVVRPRGVA